MSREESPKAVCQRSSSPAPGNECGEQSDDKRNQCHEKTDFQCNHCRADHDDYQPPRRKRRQARSNMKKTWKNEPEGSKNFRDTYKLKQGPWYRQRHATGELIQRKYELHSTGKQNGGKQS
jgi:hypothetical protein